MIADFLYTLFCATLVITIYALIVIAEVVTSLLTADDLVPVVALLAVAWYICYLSQPLPTMAFDEENLFSGLPQVSDHELSMITSASQSLPREESLVAVSSDSDDSFSLASETTDSSGADDDADASFSSSSQGSPVAVSVPIAFDPPVRFSFKGSSVASTKRQTIVLVGDAFESVDKPLLPPFGSSRTQYKLHDAAAPVAAVHGKKAVVVVVGHVQRIVEHGLDLSAIHHNHAWRHQMYEKFGF
jgi:hypothetical protein